LFGDSRYPFDHPNAREGITYDESTTPRTQKVLDHLVQPMCPTQFMSEEDVEDIAAAIRKVAEGLNQ
jgi:hypothetical protein